MSVPLRIAVLVFVTCVGYCSFGNYVVPQDELHPPPSVDDPDTAPLDLLAETGEGIFPGQCEQCHGKPGTGGTQRAPDLDGVANRAATVASERGYTAEDYLAESLCDPGAYLVKRDTGDPYGNIMSFKLAPEQILAVLVYLQTLGGAPTEAIRDAWKSRCAQQAAAAAAAPSGPKDVGPPEQIVTKYGCVACHDVDGTQIRSAPPLGNVGSRMSVGDIFMQIVAPDSETAKDPPDRPGLYVKGLMKQTLDNNGFYRDVGPEDLHKLALWLAAKK